MTRIPVLTSLLATAALTVTPLSGAGAGNAGHSSGSAARGGPPDHGLEIGASSRSVLPLVDGSYEYLNQPLPSRDDAIDPGILVPEWDDGRIAVGNGDTQSYWVHDDLRVSAMAIEDTRTRDIVVLLTSDLYMIFRNDAAGIRAKATALVPAADAERMTVIVTADHNHHGPDTAFDVNHDWYEHMTDQAAAAIASAVAAREPATLRAATGAHWFGARDGTDPQVYDPTLQVLQARNRLNRTIATVVQWNNHPETTLGWAPPPPAIVDDCVVLGLTGDDCTAEGRYFTADFPGVTRTDLQQRYGGEVLYTSGALGVLTTPLGAQVWEVTPRTGLGNQLVPPAGAQPAGGGTDFTARNFRRAVVIGEQLSEAVERLLRRASRITDTRMTYASEPFTVRLSNFGFRVLLVVDPATGRSQLGHEPGVLLTCPDAPDDHSTCVTDGLASAHDDTVGVDHRVGDHLQSAVEYLRIGPVGMMFLPGEMSGELVNGLPATFRSAPGDFYSEPPGTHAFGDALTTPGFVRQRMHDTYEWTVSLGSDELGYVIPISNFRVKCVLDEFVPGGCAQLFESGEIEFADAVAGATCKGVAEDPTALEGRPPLAVLGIGASCKYGQALGEAAGHYEETNSASWDLAQAVLDTVGTLTGDHDPSEVNADFPGWWSGHLPPGRLP
jgi:hypothetical protein